METRVVVVGAGSTGSTLSACLGEKHQVILVDKTAPSASTEQATTELDSLGQATAGRRGVWRVCADGSSRLVLEALYDPDTRCALVATAGGDRVNLEAGRLGREVGFDPVIAIQHDSARDESYRQHNITALDRSRLLADQVERSLRVHGAVVPSGIGLGQGELIEIRLLNASPVLHRPLKELAPHRWRVAAVFRGDALIVPVGDTVLEVDDRVLLVGDPRVLPTVAGYLRMGTPQFPRPYGPNVVTLEPAGEDPALADEAEGLARGCGAAQLRRGIPGGEHTDLDEEPEPLTVPAHKGRTGRGTFPVPSTAQSDFAAQVLRQRPGVVVTHPQLRSWFDRLLGRRGRDAELCDRLRVPVLFARGGFPYRRVLLPVSGSGLDIPAAELAIDVTRQLGAALTAVNVDLPPYISGVSGQAVHEDVVPVRRLCELYEVPFDYHHHEGNPVRHVLAETGHHDLVVVARHFHRRDTYFDPDVSLRIARGARCSVLVLTVRPGE